MARITLVGCGFVGSIFAHEAVRRLHTAEVEWDWSLIDDDKVEERNCSNQNYTPSDDGHYKAEMLARHIQDWQDGVKPHLSRLTNENINELIEDDTVLIVDAVDNLATRQLLWAFGLEKNIPVLHIGMTAEGMGKVEWTTKEIDTFSLSPIVLQGRELPDPPSGETPPCELARMRGAGLNVGFAAAVALGHFIGVDFESFLGGTDQPHFTTWSAVKDGYTLHPEFTTACP